MPKLLMSLRQVLLPPKIIQHFLMKSSRTGTIRSLVYLLSSNSKGFLFQEIRMNQQMALFALTGQTRWTIKTKLWILKLCSNSFSSTVVTKGIASRNRFKIPTIIRLIFLTIVLVCSTLHFHLFFLISVRLIIK